MDLQQALQKSKYGEAVRVFKIRPTISIEYGLGRPVQLEWIAAEAEDICNVCMNRHADIIQHTRDKPDDWSDDPYWKIICLVEAEKFDDWEPED